MRSCPCWHFREVVNGEWYPTTTHHSGLTALYFPAGSTVKTCTLGTDRSTITGLDASVWSLPMLPALSTASTLTRKLKGTPGGMRQTKRPVTFSRLDAIGFHGPSARSA